MGEELMAMCRAYKEGGNAFTFDSVTNALTGTQNHQNHQKGKTKASTSSLEARP
jgi:hypothetical protein